MALETRTNLETELQSRLQVASNSTLFPAARLTELIQQGNIWATQYYPWDDLFKWLKTSTVSSRNYYLYPVQMRSNTIVDVQIDGLDYSRYDYEDFETERITNPTSTEKIFASKGRYYFINPTPTANGSTNLHIYGCCQVAAPYDLANGTDNTIFSLSSAWANEAIVKKALSVAIGRSNTAESQKEEAEAKAILAKLQDEQKVYGARSKRINHPKFNVPDYFASSNSYSPIGRFNYNPNQ